MQISPLSPPGMMSSYSKLAENAARSAMQSVKGAVAPVFDTGKSGIVPPDPVDLSKETFSAMESGTLTYKKPPPR